MSCIPATNSEKQLAIHGGKPVRETWLPYGRQDINDADIASVTSILRSDWLTQGPAIAEFEQAIAQHCGVNHAVAVSNGTAALHAAYFSVGVTEGDEIIMPGMSFAATANAALYLGARPMFVDINPANGNILVESIEKSITPKTRAIVAVDFAGHPCDMDALRTLADKFKLPLIVDGAHALGAQYKGAPAPKFADITTFSFHPVKSITTGEGGMIVTNNDQYADRLRLFRSHGIEKNAGRFAGENQGPWYHEMQELGFNYRMTDFQAALGTSQLKRLHEFVARRRAIAASYRQKLKELKHFRCLDEASEVESAYHLFPLLVTRAPFAPSRKLAVEALHGENIGVQVHYVPIYSHPYYKRNVCTIKPSCPNTDLFYEQVFSLPMFPAMSDRDVEDVCRALKKVDEALNQQPA